MHKDVVLDVGPLPHRDAVHVACRAQRGSRWGSVQLTPAPPTTRVGRGCSRLVAYGGAPVLQRLVAQECRSSQEQPLRSSPWSASERCRPRAQPFRRKLTPARWPCRSPTPAPSQRHAPRSTEPYHTEDPAPSLTSPSTVALGATNTLSPSAGSLPATRPTVCALFTAGPGAEADALARLAARHVRPIAPTPRPDQGPFCPPPLTSLLVGEAALQRAAQPLQGLARGPQGLAQRPHDPRHCCAVRLRRGSAAQARLQQRCARWGASRAAGELRAGWGCAAMRSSDAGGQGSHRKLRTRASRPIGPARE